MNNSDGMLFGVVAVALTTVVGYGLYVVFFCPMARLAAVALVLRLLGQL